MAEYKLSYTASQIDAKLGKIDGLAAKSEVPTKLSDLTDDKGYLTAIPSEYITETELAAKGYLTQHQSLDAYAKTADLGDLAKKDTVAKTDLSFDLQTTIDNKADKSEGAFFVEGSGTTDATAKTSTWTGESDRITEYYDGLTIRYKIGVAGQNTVTLNINNLGAKTIYRFSTTKLTTQFPVGSIIHLVYHEDLNDGCWVTNDYDANTNTYQRVYVSSDNKEYPITTRYNTTTGTSYYAEYGRYNDGVTLNPSTKTITATAFKGKLTGNADTATKATQDASGNVITTTYETKADANDKVAEINEQISQLSSEKDDLTDRVDRLDQDVVSIQAENLQQVPLYANSIEECTDTSKMYVLPDGFIYAYMEVTTEGGADYTNLVPTSTDTDGSIFNGVGYKENVRLSSSGGVSGTAQDGSVTVGFMPWQSKGTIRIKGATFIGITTGHYYVNFYAADKTLKYAFSTGEIIGITGANNNILASYDEASGVTTVDFSNCPDGTGRATDAIINAAYFRINAYGKGADLVVTVNQEIKEAGTSIGYTWANTGHAFVPADYEDRIVELERQVEDNIEIVEELEQKVNNILDGTSEITASAKFDPTVYDLPVLYLTGDVSPIAVSKDNKVTLEYGYQGRTGTCILKGQGATSYKMAKAFVDQGKAGKFNYTIKFDNAFEAAEGWTAQSKYCLKANWIDHTHSRNIVSAKLWGLIVKNRATQNTNLSGLVNGGAIDGFPIVIMLNGEFHGLYTFNIPKDGWMFGMEEDATKTQAIVCASDHSTCTQFKSAGMSGFEVEFASDEDSVDWVATSMNRLITACINSDGKDLDTTIANYLDWESAIDYYIFIVLIKGTDMVDKNYLLTTFDGTKWYFSAYDIDSTYGLNWDGSGLTRAVSNCNFVECAESHRVYELIKKYKVSALKSRYEELRSNILSETRICQYFENFAWDISTPILLEDVKKYPTIRGSSVNGIDQICRWVRQRLEVADEWVNAL